MIAQVPFINREHELAQIAQLIDASTNLIICLNGPGGIGKTRLLQEIRQRFTILPRPENQKPPEIRPQLITLFQSATQKLGTGSPLIFTDILDLDDPLLHIPQNFGHTVANMLDKDIFEPYIQALVDLRRLEMAGIAPQKLARENLPTQRAFVNAFNKISAHQRIGLLLDTSDALKNQTELWHYLAKLFPELNNCIWFIAGRDNQQTVGKFLAWQIEGKQIEESQFLKIIDLSPWNSENTVNYIHQKQQFLRSTLEPNLVNKLVSLTQGRPALVDLALEWHSHDVPLNWLADSSLEDFQAQLICHITDIPETFRQLILAMAHLYPIDKPLVARLFPMLSATEIDQLWQTIQTYSLVKKLPDGKITLPSKIRQLVDQYLWQVVDPSGEYRLKLSEIAVKHCEDNLKEINDQIQTLKQGNPDAPELVTLEERQDLFIKHQITQACYANLKQGFGIYTAAAEKARRAKRRGFAKQLERIMQPYRPRFTADQLYEFNLLYGKLLTELGNAEESAKLLHGLLHENEFDQMRQADIYNALAMSEVELCDLPDALEHQHKCLAILTERQATQYISPVSNYLGYIYRLNGKWAESMQYYQQALALQAPQSGMAASTMNNLGYVLGLDGQYEAAMSYCQKALEIWRNQRNELNIGQGESALGAIYRNKGDYNQAETYLHRAIYCFQKSQAIGYLVEAYLDLGLVYLMRGSDPYNDYDIEQACYCFEKSLSIATDNLYYKINHKITLYYSYAYWEQGQKEKALLFNERAYWMSLEFHDMYTVVHSIVAMAEYDYGEGRYDNIAVYAEELKRDYENRGYFFPLLFGRMRRIQAEIAWQKQDYEMAFNHYAEGLLLIAQHGGYGKYSLPRELEALQRKLATLPPNQASAWQSRLKTYWKNQEPNAKITALMEW